MNEINSVRNKSVKLETSAPVLNNNIDEIKPAELRNRKQTSNQDEELRAEALRKVETAQKNDEEEEEEQMDETDEDVESFEKDMDVKIHEEMNEDEEEVDLVDESQLGRRPGPMSLLRLFFYALLFVLSFVTLIYYALPIVVPSCCDYRKDYLVFNERNYNNDGMLPF